MNLTVLKRSLKPFRWISLMTTYGLGAGLVQYVREVRQWSLFFEGLLFLLLVAISLELLRLLNDLTSPLHWPEGADFAGIKQIRVVIVILIAILMTSATAIFLGWMVKKVMSQSLAFLVLGFFLVGILYFLTKNNRTFRSSQLIIESILFVIIPPAIAFFIQSNDFHRFLPLVVIGLVPAYLAYRILEQITRFGEDQMLDRMTFVTQLGWEKAMTFHNGLILLTFFLFALITLFRFPWFLVWPVFLSLPIGLLEIWLMERIRRGAKPFWRVMKFASALVFFLPIYLIGFTFWIR